MLSCLTALTASAPTTLDHSGRPVMPLHTTVARSPAPTIRTTIRSTEMLLLNEALARAEHARRLDEAQAGRTRRRLLAEARTYRLQRRTPAG
ncbi:hypothetical protein CLV35_2767 [Motilibacter peucedani]|uniref:Uncharacterized protein n=1 Tax=Motilibacter peucedani TaxID=598650 RepID=A0A420XML9_9ACTN|nr:hypothetical protein [Motilibacter peucedani]RKS72522.1 hypothetical protein CLV35_2767 [Motilibacter peucedani]